MGPEEPNFTPGPEGAPEEEEFEARPEEAEVEDQELDETEGEGSDEGQEEKKPSGLNRIREKLGIDAAAHKPLENPEVRGRAEDEDVDWNKVIEGIKDKESADEQTEEDAEEDR